MLKRFQRCIAVALLLTAASKGHSQTPQTVVSQFHAALTHAMQQSVFEDRLALLTPVVTSHFQVHTIARISLGRNWRTLSTTEQADYQQLMATLISTTYAARFNTFNDQVFSILAQEAITQDRQRVRSILKTKTDTVSLDYQLQASDDGWKIYDVVANGVSDLSLKRSNYAAIFSAGGLPAVTGELQRNIEQNRHGDPE